MITNDKPAQQELTQDSPIEQVLNFKTFDPTVIPYQYDVIYDIKNHFDYSKGPHYIMLSGSIGSAKSTLLAWLAVKHCTEFNGARCLLGRKSLVDLTDTIFQEILDMLEGALEENVDFWVNHTRKSIRFKNGSEIISRSWHDRKFKKFRSLKLSMIIIEELTENDEKDWKFFDEVIGRLGRAKDKKNRTIPENIFIAATNPDDPSHPAYKFFIKGSKKKGHYASKADEDGNVNIHTYYSLTEQNPFLPSWYHASLRKKYDAKMIRRMLFGEWLYINTDVIYYNYDPEKHVRPNLKIDKELPLRLSFDFNISKGKPMSSCLLQFDPKARNKVARDKRFTFLDEVAIEGARTLTAMEEWAGKGYFDLPHNPKIIIHGDQTGTKSDSRGVQSDYDIIEKFLANYERKDAEPLEYDIDLPSINPPVRERHNITNGQLENADNEVAVVVDEKCYFVDAGFSNTRLAENSKYTEDQTTEGQDMSTAATYAIHYCVEYEMIDEEDILFS